MPWWIILVLVLAAAGAVYWRRSRIKGWLATLPLIGRALADVANDVPALRRPEPPRTEPKAPDIAIVPDIPDPPPVDAPIVREDDPPVELTSDDFGGPIPRGFGDRFDRLTEVTLRQIHKYVPSFDTKAKRYFLDPSFLVSAIRVGGGFARVSPGRLISQRATEEAGAIPVFSVSALQNKGLSAKQIRGRRDEFIEKELKPALTEQEFAWLLDGGSLTGPSSVHRLARRRAEAAMPDWLRAGIPGEGTRE